MNSFKALYSINLSRTPFRNRRPFWIAWAAACLVLAFGVQWTLGAAQDARRQEEQRVKRKDDLERQLRDEQAKFDDQRRVAAQNGAQATPEQLQSMREIMLLAQRKRFSWSRFLNQLESEIPATIRVMQVSFDDQNENASEGVAPTEEIPFTITLRAVKPESVTDFIRQTDRRGVFRFDPATQAAPDDNTRPGQSVGPAEVEFSLVGKYRPNASSPSQEPPQ
jgi:hypothetical protein